MLLFRLLLQFVALMAGVAAMTVLAFAYRAQRRQLALPFLLFLASLWWIVLAFGVNELSILSGSDALFLTAALLFSLGSMAFFAVAPFFYHAVLKTPMTFWRRRSYLALDMLLLFLVGGLAWERYRGLAVIALHYLVFAMVLYGIVLGILRYRYLEEASRRRAVVVFVVLSLICFPAIYWEARPAETAPLLRNDWLDGVALPAYYLALSALSISFIDGGSTEGLWWARRRGSDRTTHRPS